MIRHDAPGVEIVAVAVEMEERVFQVFSDFRMAEGTAAHAGIEPLFDF